MENKNRDSMIIYRSFYESIKEIPTKDQAIIWQAVFEYGLNFQEIKLTGIASTIFKLIKPQLDANLKKFQNGLKGGAPKSKENLNVTKTEPKQNLNQTKSEANVNVNVNDNVNDNVNGFSKAEKHNNFFKNIWKQDIWVESVCMQFKKDKHEVQSHLNRFRLECISKEEYKESEKDAKNHFINWVKKGNEIPREFKPTPFKNNGW